MAIPGFQEFMLPLLKIAEAQGDVAKKIYEEVLADQFQLTEEDRNAMIKSGGDLVYRNRIGWAVSHLVKAGLLERPARATIRLTERGRDLLSKNPPPINIALLKQYPEYREFQKATRVSKDDEDGAESDQISPLEQLEQAHKRLRQALASDLIDSMKQMPPASFEQLVVDVLVAMGYGGTIADAGQAIGRSGDGGIDGVIKEDRLGLDFIYVQANRWENTIQRPQLQGFAGALLGRNAQRGVFITTSDFSKGAVDFAKSLPTNIVLVDGQQLAELMIDYGVGVIDEQTYRVKRVDPEYFGE